MYGPLWLGELHDPKFVSSLSRDGETGKLFEKIESEIQTVTHYDIHNLCRNLKISPPSVSDVIKALRDHGYLASRTRFSGTSFKTDAEIGEIRGIILRIHQQP